MSEYTATYDVGVYDDSKYDTLVTPQTIKSDSYIKQLNNTKTIVSDSFISETKTKTITSDSWIKATGTTKTISSDSYIKKLGNDKTVLSNSYIEKLEEVGSLISNSYIEVINNTTTKLSDSYISQTITKTIKSDSYVLVPTSKTILSNSYIRLLGGTELTTEGIVDSYSETNQDSHFSAYNGSLRVEIGQSFTGDGATLSRAKFYLRKTGSPTGNATAYIYTHTGTFGYDGIPTGSALATSSTIDVSSISSTGFELVTFTFSGVNQIILTSGTYYFVTIRYSGGDSSNHLDVGFDITTPTHGGNAATTQTSWDDVCSSWYLRDLCFYVYANTTTYANTYDVLSNSYRKITGVTSVISSSFSYIISNNMKLSSYYIKQLGVTKTINSDSHIFRVVTETTKSDSYIYEIQTETISSDSYRKKLGITSTIFSNSRILGPYGVGLNQPILTFIRGSPIQAKIVLSNIQPNIAKPIASLVFPRKPKLSKGDVSAESTKPTLSFVSPKKPKISKITDRGTW